MPEEHPRHLALTDVSRLLRVDYDRLHRAIVRGDVKAHRAPISRRWFVDQADLPAIAALFEVELPDGAQDGAA